MKRMTLPHRLVSFTLLSLVFGLFAFPPGGLSAADRFVDAIEVFAQGDYPAALQQLNTLAEKGDVRALCWLGFMYQKGEGIKKNFAEAAKWYRKAAELGCERAAHKLGHMYEIGEGVPLDIAEAAKWYRVAAEQGNASAQEDLGGMCARGAGVPRDYVEAYMWLDLAATRFSGPATGEEAAKKRDSIASMMSPAELAKAQRRVREWKPKKER